MSNQKNPANSTIPVGLEQVREIRFGEAQRDTSSKMETMSVALQQLRADRDSTLGEVEQSLSSEISKLRTFVDEFVADLKEALQDVAAADSQELKEARKTIESNLKELEQVMEPFVQGKRLGDSRAQGTGLGLPMVQSLFALHGGDFEILSTPGTGTTAVAKLSVEQVRHV